MKRWKVGDRVVAPMQYGYAPVHGVIEDIWVNCHGVEMASVNYGGKVVEGKVDMTGLWHRTVTTKSLKAWA